MKQAKENNREESPRRELRRVEERDHIVWILRASQMLLLDSELGGVPAAHLSGLDR